MPMSKWPRLPGGGTEIKGDFLHPFGLGITFELFSRNRLQLSAVGQENLMPSEPIHHRRHDPLIIGASANEKIDVARS